MVWLLSRALISWRSLLGWIMSHTVIRPPRGNYMSGDEYGFTIWITGTLGSGKTMVARRLEARFRRKGLKVEFLTQMSPFIYLDG